MKAHAACAAALALAAALPGPVPAAWDDPVPASAAPAPADPQALPPASEPASSTHPSSTDPSAADPAPAAPADSLPDSAHAALPPDPGSLPALILLPMARDRGADSGEAAKAEAGLRLGLAESGRFRILTAEAAARDWPGGSLPSDCFEARCFARAAGASPVPLVVASDFSAREGAREIRVALGRAPDGRIQRALRARAEASREGTVAFARAAGLRLASPDAPAPGDPETAFASGTWKSIPWLNARDTIDHRARAGWAGAGLLAAGAALAYAQGQLTGSDGNSSSPARPLGPSSGAFSFLRGFFAAPTLGARYAAMGGAGLAAVDDGLALLMNPAGVARADRENVVMAKRSLPDGAPSFFVAYAGPLHRGWHQGLGAQYEGDRLASETTVFGSLARDLGMLGRAWEGVKAGAQAKLYLAQAGESGTGMDRATGHSFGMGWDFGVQAPLGERITAALSVRDAFGFLRHENTFTDRSYGEILPIEWKVGAAYRAGRGLTLLLDGQKAIWADQADHLRVGGEQVLWDFLALRGGLHEALGRETVRKLAVGFGLDSGGLKEPRLKEAASKFRLSLSYAYEFGLEAEAPLAGGQQFSLEAGF